MKKTKQAYDSLVNISYDSFKDFLHEQSLNLLVLLPFRDIITPTKIVRKLFIRACAFITLSTVVWLFCSEVSAQQAYTNDTIVEKDSTFNEVADTLPPSQDSVPKKKKSVVDAPVYYSSADSMHILVKNQKVMLYGKGKMNYQDFNLESEYVESNLSNKEIFAKGVTDTNNAYVGRPKFKQGNEEFENDSMRYNMETSKGLIYNVVSEQSEGYLHSELTKRDSDGHIHVKGGKYTTCDLEHPHFYLELTKAIVIPDDKIISGPAYLVVEDIPLPMLGLPFSFFPNSQQRGAGIILPSYGEEKTRGFYLKEGGWYQPLGEYVDLTFLGAIYSKGSWSSQLTSKYKVRYRFNGNMQFNYAINDDNSDPDYVVRKDFSWRWSHTQDAKANPNQSLSANVNFSSSGYEKSNSKTISESITSQKSSSISFTRNWPGTPFNLAISANATQNTSDSTVSISLPTGSFSSSTIYPFRKKSGGSGAYKWYENIGFSYKSSFASKLQNIKDSLLYDSETWRNTNAGFTQSIPFVINVKTEKIKMLTISPSLNYEGRMSNSYITKHIEGNLDHIEIAKDTIHKITYAHAINPTISVGLSPKVYGMYVNSRTDPKIIAVRHVVQPKASFSFTPDMSKINPNYYDTVRYVEDGKVKEHKYSHLEETLYGTPSSAGKNGSLSLSLSNSLEMKRRPKNDTTGGEAEPEKVTLLRSLSVSTSYKPFEDEFRWNDLSINGSSQLFKNKLSLNVTSRFSLYDLNEDGNKINEYYYDNGKGILRFTNLNISSSIKFSSKKSDSKEEDEEEDPIAESNTNLFYNPNDSDVEFEPGLLNTGAYANFDVPWSLNINYSWALNRPKFAATQTRTHTVRLNGDFSITEKWKVGYNTGYDFEAKEVTTSNISINRDLHCWVMSFTVVPFGTYQSYTFTINAKASLLKDLKWDKKQNWYDNF